jgi:hypothetical protein
MYTLYTLQIKLASGIGNFSNEFSTTSLEDILSVFNYYYRNSNWNMQVIDDKNNIIISSMW